MFRSRTEPRPHPAPPPPGPPFARPAPFRSLVALLLVAMVGVGLASVSIGSVGLPLDLVWTVIGRNLGLLPTPPGGTDPVTDQIVWSVRLPRAVLGLVVGAGLAVAGVVIQTVVRNPLGDPYLIGVVPGAGLGAVAVIVLGAGAVGGIGLAAAAFVGALGAFALVFALARQRGGWPPTRLVLAGVAVGYLLSSVTYYLQTIAAPNQVQRVLFWSLGSVASAEWGDLAVPVVVTVLGTAWLSVHGRRLNALVGGPEIAGSLGLAVGRFQLQLMAVAAVVTGSLVAVAGGIGFVGLVVPHVARLLVGADHRRVIVTSVLLGALFLPLSDIAARTLRAPAELPVGIVTAAIGAPFFLWLLRSERRTGRV